jgi:hypothetical protein
LTYRRILIAVIFCVGLSAVWFSCSDDGGGGKVHWFDCKPVFQKLADCGIEISFDDINIADPDEAYDSCQYAHGNMWLRMYKCYKENESCDDLAECLPEHGFITPGDDTAADDTSADDTSADDTSADDTSDDTTDDTSDDDTAGDTV